MVLMDPSSESGLALEKKRITIFEK